MNESWDKCRCGEILSAVTGWRPSQRLAEFEERTEMCINGHASLLVRLRQMDGPQPI